MAYLVGGLPDRVLLEDLNDVIEIAITKRAAIPIDRWGVPWARSMRAAASIQGLF